MAKIRSTNLELDSAEDDAEVFKYLHFRLKEGRRDIVWTIPAPGPWVKHVEIETAFVAAGVPKEAYDCLGGGMITVDHVEKKIWLTDRSRAYGHDRARGDTARVVREFYPTYAVECD